MTLAARRKYDGPMKSRVYWIAGGLILGFVIGLGVSLAVPKVYISKALLHEVPAAVPDYFVPKSSISDSELFTRAVQHAVLTHGNVSNLISSYNLYPSELAHVPMEDMHESLIRNLKMEAAQNHS